MTTALHTHSPHQTGSQSGHHRVRSTTWEEYSAAIICKSSQQQTQNGYEVRLHATFDGEVSKVSGSHMKWSE